MLLVLDVPLIISISDQTINPTAKLKKPNKGKTAALKGKDEADTLPQNSHVGPSSYPSSCLPLILCYNIRGLNSCGKQHALLILLRNISIKVMSY